MIKECPQCHRPVNEGNSPNEDECHETNDEEGLCAAYAKIFHLREAVKYAVAKLPYATAMVAEICRNALEKTK